MALDSIPQDVALVLIDLQRGITSLPTQPPAEEVVAKAAKLADAFRAKQLPVVLVRVQPLSAGAPPTDVQPPPMKVDETFAQLRPELGAPDVDIVKPAWDAFVGTGLDLQLRRRRVKTLVLGGIRTAIGVESTARTAFILGYATLFLTDVMADVDASLHDRALNAIFPRLGRRTTSDEVLSLLSARERER